MNNQELIANCRAILQGEEEPHQMDWIDMVEGLCGALEKADIQIALYQQQLNEADEQRP